MGVRGLLKLLRTKVRKLEEDDHGDREDEVSSWDFRDVSRRAETFVRRLGRCGVAAQFVDDGARGSGGVAEMESKVQVKNLKAFLEGSGIEPKEKQRCGFFTLAVHHGLQAAGAPVQLADGEADPVLAAELMKPRRGDVGCDPWGGWGSSVTGLAMQVSEEVLPMAAALCGNAHSKPIIEECPDGEGQLTDQFASLAALLQTALEDGRNPEDETVGGHDMWADQVQVTYQVTRC
eukprot:Skav213895  [mRNA]  locus=scaffold245:389895:397160:- [translate_table: standard]